MKHKVLLVDDEEKSLIRSLRHSLPPETWELVPVSNPKQVVAKWGSGGTDLIVMALDSRAAAGWEAIDEITEANPFLPVIVVTKEAGLENLAEAVGARAVAEQPVHVPALVETMGKLVGELSEKQTHGNRTVDAGFGKVASSGGGSLENLQRRYAAPYPTATPFRNWGINE